jgi:alkyl hydroperoxide reductase subunit AhpC
MLADPTMETARAYGVGHGRSGKNASRWTFYIDKQGKIAAIDNGSVQAGRDIG